MLKYIQKAFREEKLNNNKHLVYPTFLSHVNRAQIMKRNESQQISKTESGEQQSLPIQAAWSESF